MGGDFVVELSQRRAIERRVCLVAASTVLTVPGRRPVQRWIRAIFDKGCSCSRSAVGTLTRIDFSEIIEDVRAFTATSLATLMVRIISTTPSAVLGTASA